eukprot:gene10631-13013_t
MLQAEAKEDVDKLADLRIRYQLVTSQLVQANEKSEDIQVKYSAASAEVGKLQHQVQQLELQRAECSELLRLERTKMAELLRASEDSKDVADKYSVACAEMDKLHSQVQQMEALYKESSSALLDEKEKASASEEKAMRAQKCTDELSGQLALLTSQYTDSQEQIRALTISCDELKQQCDSMSSRLVASEQERTSLAKKLEASENKEKKREKKYQELKEKHEALHSSHV